VTLAVVTGASRGIGRATALALATRGVGLALLGRPSPALDETCRLAEARGASAACVACDLRDAQAVERAGARVLAELGTPDVVIHNAGTIVRAPVEATRLADWDDQLAVNLRAPFVLTRSLLPAMRARGAGRLLFVASISATLGSPRAAAYAASKWGLVGFMKSLAEEISDSGLMTVAILPGSVATDMLDGSGFSARMSAEDVAGTLIHYALEANRAHNGGVIEMFGT
jgi:3-oxoacyl-[acyl-carrier protein] reductase